MTKLHIHRHHTLGLTAARQMTSDWTAQAQQQWGLVCERETFDDCERVSFTGKGASGTLAVTAHDFTLDLALGFLLGAYKKRMEAQIQHNLDQLLGAPSGHGTTPVSPGSVIQCGVR
jgi:putative polyhydroxyalkanoate system protein